MKKNKYLALWGVGLMFAASSCTDGYEKEPVERYTIDYLFSRSDSMGVQSRRFLNNIYMEHLKSGYNQLGGDFLDAASDDAISLYTPTEPAVYNLLIGNYSAMTRRDNMGWSEYYKGIRKTNILINNIDYVPFKLTYVNAKGEIKPLNFTMKAEARFLRAYLYFELLKRYGGVPLVYDNVYELGDDLELARCSFAQCVEYIVDELDDIQDDLRSIPTQDAGDYAHTPTKQACMAMKSRVLLYAASPLFNENTLESGNELVGYKSYDRGRWNIAAQAAKDLIEQFGPNGTGALGLAGNYRDIFTQYYESSRNPEIIFFHQSGKGKSVETANGPLGFAGNAMGNGRTNPTQNLVESFPMLDGKMPGKSDKYAYNPKDAPYVNRDPRLGYTVLHNGSYWLQSNLDTSIGGTNNPSGAMYSQTSYYMCKFMNDYSNPDKKEYEETIHLWVHYRYGEILLNYAEALNEYLDSPSDDVYDAIIQLRKRAGIEEGDDHRYGLSYPMTQEEMRRVIQNERRIEMAFEEQRFWDIRRWRLAEEIFAKPIRGVEPHKVGNSIVYDEVEVISADVINFKYPEHIYLYPIPYTEVVKNRNMVQNPKW